MDKTYLNDLSRVAMLHENTLEEEDRRREGKSFEGLTSTHSSGATSVEGSLQLELRSDML